MYRRNAQGWFKHVDFFIVDAITLNLVLMYVYAIRFNAWLYADPDYINLSLIMLFCDAFVFLCFNTMHNVLKRGFYVEFRETLRHCVFLFLLIMLLLYFRKVSDLYSRTVIFSTFTLHIFLGYGSRLFWKWFVKHHRIPVMQKRRILALLDPENAKATMEQINHNPAENYQIIGIILTGESDQTVIDGVPVVASMDEAADYLCQGSVDSIYIDCPITDPDVVELMNACTQMAIPIQYRIATPYGEGVRHFVERIGGQTVLTSSLNVTTQREQFTKRVMDIIGGLFGSLCAVLLILILGPLIKKASPGPILYTQERIGRNGRRFKMYKLRSMCVGADDQKQELMEQNRVSDNRMFKLDNDPRVIGNTILPDGTCKKGIGDFIRRTSLDEFPQFFNVLLGQMSLVGTRPPTVDEWKTYEYHHRARLACKPGITGLWQVSGRSAITDFEEVVKLDTQYISNWSVGLDILILLKTIVVVCRRKGAL